MTSTLLNIARKVDPTTLTILQSVADAAQHLSIPLFVIGAAARDLVLHYHYGAAISRATQDLDFAIQIPDWAAFDALKLELLQNGFSETKVSHRLTTEEGGWIDLVPFGPVSNDGKVLAWPPNGDVVMTILGFSEAYEHALQVRITESPATDISVVSPVGLALLKLVSWTERGHEKRPNDAKDLLYVCTNYLEIPDVENEMYDHESMMETYRWVPECGSAFLLGRDVSAIATTGTHAYLEQLFGEEIVNRSMRDLIRESCETNGQFEAHEARINAFIDGYWNR